MIDREYSKSLESQKTNKQQLTMTNEKLHIEEVFTDGFKQISGMCRTAEQMLQPMVGRMLSVESRFCQEAVAAGRLSAEGMQRAAERYKLGRSRKGETVFWMIDEQQVARDARVGESWASVLLKQQGVVSERWCPQHCLFGLHLMSQHTIAVVEDVEAAVILSELYPKYTWMATGYAGNLDIRVFLPLAGRRVICFPPTDETGESFILWQSIGNALREFHVNVSVSDVLEKGASDEQKARGIGLLDFLFATE